MSTVGEPGSPENVSVCVPMRSPLRITRKLSVCAGIAGTDANAGMAQHAEAAKPRKVRRAIITKLRSPQDNGSPDPSSTAPRNKRIDGASHELCQFGCKPGGTRRRAGYDRPDGYAACHFRQRKKTCGFRW